jgi:8-oxo-dGTP pyrophosphatase MutT (NUDIX family)
MKFEPRIVSRDLLARSPIFDVERMVFEHDGVRFERDVIRHPGAVAILAYDGECVVLVRQWRAPLLRAILEIPAGLCDVAGESLEATARRELEEETGVVAAQLEPLLDLWISPGSADQRLVVFLATGLRETPRRPVGPEEVAMEILRLPLDEVVETALAGSCDAKTATAVLALKARLAS